MDSREDIVKLGMFAIDAAKGLNDTLLQLLDHIAEKHPANACCAMVLNEHLPDFAKDDSGGT